MPPTPSRSRRTRSRKAIRQIGPGLILAASIVGTGELINTTSLGAKAGFSLLWLILLSCVIKVFVQVELGRYAITHGKTTLAAFDSLPGPRAGVSWLCWLWLIMMLTTQAQIAAMEGTVGQAAHMAFPGASRPIAEAASFLVASWRPYLLSHQEHFWAALTTLAAVLLLLSGGYRRLERITTVLVAAVTLFTVASVLILQWTRFRITRGRPRAAGSSWPSRRPRWPWRSRRSGSRASGPPSSSPIPYWCIEKGYARYTGAQKRRRSLGPPRSRLDPRDAARRLVQHGRLHRGDGRVLLPRARPSCIRRASTPKGPEMIPTLSRMYLQPLEGTPLAWLRAVHARRLPARGLGRPVQDALRRHGRQQPADGRLPPPARALEIRRPRRARSAGQALLRDLSRRCRWGSTTPSASPRA